MAVSSILRQRWFVVVPTSLVAFLLLGFVGLCVGFPCFSTGIPYGLWLDQCPATDLRLEVDVEAMSLVRGSSGWVNITPKARYLEDKGLHAYPVSAVLPRGVKAKLTFTDDQGQAIDGLDVGSYNRGSSIMFGDVVLPDVPDGDYQLHAEVTTSFETQNVTVDLPLYAPAIAHVMTDRPLYKPGQEVLFRSVLLKRTDLTPLDGRPGTWRVFAPDGSEMMVERDKAGPYGVSDSSFPLDTRAELGNWRVEWSSGNTTDSTTFEVRPFRLPRFTVELLSVKPWYNIMDRVQVEGVARYTSGAPVANAPVSVSLAHLEGRWPPPLDWLEAIELTTGPNGEFEVDLQEVPSDLIERGVFRVMAQVTEEAGEVASGSTQVILSKDNLMVEAVTELGDGLIGGFNNRAYLRVSTPDKNPVRLAEITASNPWDPTGIPKEAKTDEDGVAALQLDPGDPVTVVIEAPPVRHRPFKASLPYLDQATELLSGSSLDLAERRAIDRLITPMSRCGDYTVSGSNVAAAMFVDAGGAVRKVFGGSDVLSQCVATTLRSARFPAGKNRTYRLVWHISDSLRPWLQVDTDVAFGIETPVLKQLNQAALTARRCMPINSGLDGTVVLEGHFTVGANSKAVDLSSTTRTGNGLSPSQTACIKQKFTSLRLEEPEKTPIMGIVRLRVKTPRQHLAATPQPTTQTGYELKITATADKALIGKTRFVLPVGTIPPLRLRATPSLAKPGEKVVVEMIRGPDFYGSLPEYLYLHQGSVQVTHAKVDHDSRKVAFSLPSDLDGFVYCESHGARAVIYVQPKDPLTVSLSTDQSTYRPGDKAELTVTTRTGDNPSPAGVGLVGVDSTLAQLAPLLGPDDYGRVTVRATADQPAFGAFDPRALTLGQVRGENAAKAAVLRISNLPMDAAGDDPVSGYANKMPDEVEAMTTGFYQVLEQTVSKVRAWEESAPAGEMMTPAKMVTMWDKALDEMANKGVDAYGRPLKLDILPDDLLVQVDPRQLVADGTRLPEDVVSWTRFVRQGVN
ncbi:MAG: hypothetical protein HN348_08875 [Proteobacteria bacterium]|nr:hypothetical protein [Pseudomonadota bacterium]